MHVDILIFAVIAVLLILKLKSVLGTKGGADSFVKNPFVEEDEPAVVVELRPKALKKSADKLVINKKDIDEEFNKEGNIEEGLEDIYQVDRDFDLEEFMGGAKAAFEMIVTAFARGDRDELKPLLSPKLFEDFNDTIVARELLSHSAETIIHKIKDAKIVGANLGGAMAYITVSYDVEQSSAVKDKNGAVIEGDLEKIVNIKDVWTFTRDTRLDDPNWILIETKAAE